MAKGTTIRPMLAPSVPVSPASLDMSRGPFWLSPKLDGVRDLQMNSVSKSRKLLDFPNRHTQRLLAHPILDGMDGELVVGSPTAPNAIQATTSGIMSVSGEPDVTYHLFDCWDTPELGYLARKARVRRVFMAARRHGLPVALVPQVLCRTLEEVVDAVGRNYALGYEGSMIRTYDDPYKYNRVTERQGWLLKVKEFVDSEAVITGFEEMMHNNNTATTDELGLTKRSTHKANKVGAATLGRMLGHDLHTGQPVAIGPGKMTAAERQHVWDNQALYLNKISRYRYSPYGVKDLPRFPRHIVWRDPIDLELCCHSAATTSGAVLPQRRRSDIRK